MLTSKTRDLIAGVLFCAVGLLSLFFLIPIGVDVPQSVKMAALSPDFWPTIISVAAVVSAAALIIESWLLKQPSMDDSLPEDEEGGAEVADEYTPGLAALRALILIVALFGFYLSLPTAGMVVASIVLIAAMMLYFGEKMFLLIGVLAVSVPILLYLFFRFVANVPIPLGVFGS